MTKVHNFSAGPAILPQEAIDEAVEGLKNFKGMGMSVVVAGLWPSFPVADKAAPMPPPIFPGEMDM